MNIEALYRLLMCSTEDRFKLLYKWEIPESVIFRCNMEGSPQDVGVMLVDVCRNYGQPAWDNILKAING